MSELGELGIVQFVDLNPGVSSFQRKFVAEVQRCEESERRLRYVQRECARDGIALDETDGGQRVSAPAPREMSDLESALANLERDLSDVTNNHVALRRNRLELVELRHLLAKTELFLSESHLPLSGGGAGGDAEDGETRSTYL